MMGKGQSLQLTVFKKKKKKKDSHMQRKGMDYYFILNIKINTEWIKDLDVRL